MAHDAVYTAATQARNIHDITDVMYTDATQARNIHDIRDFVKKGAITLSVSHAFLQNIFLNRLDHD